MIQVLKRSQVINAEQSAVWEFISNPLNLKLITPPYMNFTVISGIEKKQMYTGQIITYSVSPFLGIHMQWVTEITHVRPGTFFVDEQRIGPYSFWHHQHILKPHDSGTMMEDIVHYKIRGGPIGDFMNTILVKKQLENIFNYRREELKKYFDKNANNGHFNY